MFDVLWCFVYDDGFQRLRFAFNAAAARWETSGRRKGILYSSFGRASCGRLARAIGKKYTKLSKTITCNYQASLDYMDYTWSHEN